MMYTGPSPMAGLEEHPLIAPDQRVRVYAAALHAMHAHVNGFEAQYLGLLALELGDEARYHAAEPLVE